MRRTTVEDCLTLSGYSLLSFLHPERQPSGLWTWSRRGEEIASISSWRPFWESAILDYVVTSRFPEESREDVRQEIVLTPTPQPRGGARYWFLCPRCGRRSAKLYKPPRVKPFACRLCYGLTYESCNESNAFDGLFRSIAAGIGPGLDYRALGNSLKADAKMEAWFRRQKKRREYFKAWRQTRKDGFKSWQNGPRSI